MFRCYLKIGLICIDDVQQNTIAHHVPISLNVASWNGSSRCVAEENLCCSIMHSWRLSVPQFHNPTLNGK